MSKHVLFVLVTTVFGMTITAVPLQTQPEYARDDYEKPRVCQTCHDTNIKLTSQWRKSMLSYAWIDPLFQHSYRQAGEDTAGKTDLFCARCHSPISSVTEEMPPPMDVAKYGVSCDFCHTVSKATGIGNGAYVSTPGKTKRGQIPDAWSPHHRTAYADLFTRSEFCGMCHNVFDPDDPSLIEQATYSEWKESSYRKQGMQCQHCMMNTTEGVFGASEAVQGPYRWVVFEHGFLGGHWEENLKKAALLCIQTNGSEVSRSDTVDIRVKVANVGCGHMLPTGRSDLREIWLEVRALDSGGNEVYSDRRAYRTVFGDADGNPLGHRFWLAKQVLSDYRIAPNEIKTERFSFAVPENVEGTITLEAKLLYRLASQELADAAQAGTLPIITMTEAKETITVLEGQ